MWFDNKLELKWGKSIFFISAAFSVVLYGNVVAFWSIVTGFDSRCCSEIFLHGAYRLGVSVFFVPPVLSFEEALAL